MRLETLSPPVLVAVDRHPALLLARRGDRSYVQVSRGAGSNHLCWVETADVRPADEAENPLPTGDRGAAPAGGLPRSRR